MKKLLFLALLLAPLLVEAQTNTARMLAGVNAQTGTSYTFVCTDATQLVTFNNANPTSASLFAASDVCSGPGIMFSVKNIGLGTVTITPVSGAIDGATSLVLQPNQGADLWNDGANYFSQGSTSSGPPPTGFPRLDQVIDQNQNKQFNQGGATIGFANGPGMDLSGETSPLTIPIQAGCTTTAGGQLCFDATGANVHGFGTEDNTIPGFVPANVTSGNLAGFLKIGNHWILTDLGPPSSSGGTVVTATITNINNGDSLCWDTTLVPPGFTNCPAGVPVNLQTGDYTIDAVNDRGTALVENSASAHAWALGLIGEAGNFDANWFMLGMNKNTGTVTVNATAPNTFDSTGNQTETLLEGQYCSYLTDTANGIIYPKCSEPRMSASAPIVFTRSPYGLAISCPTCGGGSSTVQVNASSTQATTNFNGTTPTADANNQLLVWKRADVGSVTNAVVEVPLATTGQAGIVQLAGDLAGTSSAPTIAAQYKKLFCETGLGDGLNAMAAGTYLSFFCVNRSGVTWTITGINCWTDNNGTSTLNATNNAGTGLLTGAVTCNNTKSGGGAAGTQSATVTLANNDAVSFTFVADGTSKQTTWTVSMTQ